MGGRCPGSRIKPLASIELVHHQTSRWPALRLRQPLRPRSMQHLRNPPAAHQSHRDLPRRRHPAWHRRSYRQRLGMDEQSLRILSLRSRRRSGIHHQWRGPPCVAGRVVGQRFYQCPRRVPQSQSSRQSQRQQRRAAGVFGPHLRCAPQGPWITVHGEPSRREARARLPALPADHGSRAEARGWRWRRRVPSARAPVRRAHSTDTGAPWVRPRGTRPFRLSSSRPAAAPVPPPVR